MHEPGIYHLDEQYAAALLRPLLSTLRELEHRAAHYRAHLRMSTEDRAAIESAGQVLATARSELERLWQEQVEAGRWKQAAG